MGKLCQEKRQGFGCALIGGCCSGEGRGGRTKSGSCSATGWESISGVIWLAGSELEVGAKRGNLTFTDKVLTILGCLLHGLWFGFQYWLLKKLWFGIQVSYMG